MRVHEKPKLNISAGFLHWDQELLSNAERRDGESDTKNRTDALQRKRVENSNPPLRSLCSVTLSGEIKPLYSPAFMFVHFSFMACRPDMNLQILGICYNHLLLNSASTLKRLTKADNIKIKNNFNSNNDSFSSFEEPHPHLYYFIYLFIKSKVPKLKSS